MNSIYAPLQIVHDFKFVALNVKDDYSVLDTLDYSGKLEYVKSRIDKLKRIGYGGLVMNVDYREYLGHSDDFRLFFESAEYAKAQGMRVWIYDEQYYPSGSAGGRTLVNHPELEAIGLSCVVRNFSIDSTLGAIRVPSPAGHSELKYAVMAPIIDGEVDYAKKTVISGHKDLGGGLCYDAPNGDWRVWCFFVRPLYEHTGFAQGTRASRRYISIYNKKAVEQFYKVTFEDGYCAFSDGPLSGIVDATFTDEPYSPFYRKAASTVQSRTLMPSCSIYDEPNSDVAMYPYVPWEMSLPERYRDRYGIDIDVDLPDIFDSTPNTKEARVRFYALLSNMAREAYAETMKELLAREGVMFSGHYYGEESFDFQPVMYGDAIDHLSVMGIPGCDVLWSDINRLRYSVSCKMASSAAHLSSKKDVMIEASNMVDPDQNITLPWLKAAMSVIFTHGVTKITSYYGENLLPEDEMRQYTEHVTALARLFDGSKYKVNTLLYYPFENMCSARPPLNEETGAYLGFDDSIGIGETVAKLIKRQVSFDFINKKNLLLSQICDGYLLTVNGERVEYIVFPDISWLDCEVAEFVAKAEKNGVKVIFDSTNNEICNLRFTYRTLSDGIYPEPCVKLDSEKPYVLAMERSFGEREIFMLTNTDTSPVSISVGIRAKGECTFATLNHLTGERQMLEPVIVAEMAQIPIEIGALETVIIEKQTV